MFGWFFGKKETDALKKDTMRGFESVKKDVNTINAWIKHLDSEKNLHKKDVEEIKSVLSSMNNELEGLKNVLSIMNEIKPRNKNQTPKQVFGKQQGVYPVQTGVQTGVQTPNFDQFSVTERAILWILLNSDMRLSCDDLAAILGKERSTVRGHLNRIKQKSEGLIEEIIEKNGKKRVFIPEEIREKLLKRAKVRVKNGKKSEKDE
ncbi:MAG: winged helix-turn-helix domain-containing protein [Nanoarchaeota archaeon]|nr:winged helix-turn-helix domain-containing protein [Nanoarchaeota archaeon]MBU1501417.1 winged helix-turn-helix domain-containing protein [Nanoarchaeota archaeon]